MCWQMWPAGLIRWPVCWGLDWYSDVYFAIPDKISVGIKVGNERVCYLFWFSLSARGGVDSVSMGALPLLLSTGGASCNLYLARSLVLHQTRASTHLLKYVSSYRTTRPACTTNSSLATCPGPQFSGAEYVTGWLMYRLTLPPWGHITVNEDCVAYQGERGLYEPQ